MSSVDDLEISVEEYDVFLPDEVWGEVDASCILVTGERKPIQPVLSPMENFMPLKKKTDVLKPTKIPTLLRKKTDVLQPMEK